MQKCKAIALLNDARDNALDLLNDSFEDHVDMSLNKEIDELGKAIKNPTAFAMDILRHEMKDKSEGGLYHGWMCNIKLDVYNSLITEYDWADDEQKNAFNYCCEQGAKMFLDRLLQKDEEHV